ncbi:hypothetical protein Q670_03995 [Alcanivorax sp. P2S70]|uniref:DUF1294 domain-containing protein n=1 Tax=Alcanivorax sp. P2S70 TaxID=1397527 RepID=UPI0003B78F07|nr:DUF1294 domain-containing protein [Alcanivorax sp. P2S70]ERP89562.1 hypothetical protein Q670_03995 [Alcanivorax sp. P2S70]
MRGLTLPIALGLGIGYFAGLYSITREYHFSPFLLVSTGLISLCTLIIYGLDKRAARREHQRTPENTLHLLALFGGWPGALVARPLFRHKTRKQPFVGLFWGTTVVSLLMLGGLLFSSPLAPARDWLDEKALQWPLVIQQHLNTVNR